VLSVPKSGTAYSACAAKLLVFSCTRNDLLHCICRCSTTLLPCAQPHKPDAPAPPPLKSLMRNKVASRKALMRNTAASCFPSMREGGRYAAALRLYLD